MKKKLSVYNTSSPVTNAQQVHETIHQDFMKLKEQLMELKKELDNFNKL